MSSVGAGIFQAIFKVHSNLLQSREKPETFFWSNVVSFSLIAFFIVVGLTALSEFIGWSDSGSIDWFNYSLPLGIIPDIAGNSGFIMTLHGFVHR